NVGALAGLATPVLLLAGAGVMVMRDKSKREKVVSTARQAVEKVQEKRAQMEANSGDQGRGFGSTSTVQTGTANPPATQSPGPPAADTLHIPGVREQEIVRIVTEAFPTSELRVAPVAVRALDGSEKQTLRFT